MFVLKNVAVGALVGFIVGMGIVTELDASQIDGIGFGIIAGVLTAIGLTVHTLVKRRRSATEAG